MAPGFVQDRVGKALLLARRRVLTRLANRGTEAELRALERFDNPVAPRLARALGRMRRRQATSAETWIQRIEGERAKLLASGAPLSLPGEKEGPYDHGMSVRQACQASRRREDGVALHLLVSELT
ncbi:MAG TPA: hypothetical protein VF395_05960, partial [Polyangiaceae bacterium]